jgi:23S rRNA pseudouridine1911/1915/1917 synthase
LLGDPVYGPGFRTKAARLPPEARAALEGLGRQALHAYLLSVQHPTTGQQLEFRAELPVDLARLRHSLVTSAEAASDTSSGKPKKPSRARG